MIIALPICLLWKVRIALRQKLFLGIFLSLNLFMAITASVRVSGLKFQGTFDEVWLFLWQHIEACVAVCMISLTAFRSVFVSNSNSQARKAAAKQPWYSKIVHSRKEQQIQDSEASQRLPSIPSATLTGMRTFIQGGRRLTTMDARLESQALGEDELGWPLPKKEGRIEVRHEMMHDVRSVTGKRVGLEGTIGRGSGTELPVLS